MIRNLLIVIVLGLVLSGCASDGSFSSAKVGDTISSAGSSVTGYFAGYKSGVQVKNEDLKKIVPNKSKARDVIAAIGNPPEKKQVGQKEVWSYPYTHTPPLGATISETTVVEFNSNGVVIAAYKAGGRTSKTGNALIDTANGVN